MTTMSAVNDPIYILLVGAREKLIADFTETLKNASGVRFTYGDVVYNNLVEQMQKEHDAIKAELDVRINRRIMQLAVEELN